MIIPGHKSPFDQVIFKSNFLKIVKMWLVSFSQKWADVTSVSPVNLEGIRKITYPFLLLKYTVGDGRSNSKSQLDGFPSTDGKVATV